MDYMLLTAPAIEPVTLDDVKAWLKIDGTDEDNVLTALLVSARLSVEAVTGLMLITQSWRVILDDWPDDGRVTLPHAPLQSVNALRYYDLNHVAQPLPLSVFDIAAAARAPRLQSNAALPAPGPQVAGIEIDLTFGFGDTAATVPEPLKLAIKMLAAFWHEHRGDDDTLKPQYWPDAISGLLHPFMLRRL